MGWYADPAGSGEERYWDGISWTHNLRPLTDAPGQPLGEAVAWAPVAEPVPAPWGEAAQRPVVGAAPPWHAAPVQLATWGRRALGLVIDVAILLVAAQIILAPLSSRFVTASNDVLARLQTGRYNSVGDIVRIMQQYGYLKWAMVLLGAQVLLMSLYMALMVGLRGGTVGQLAADIRVIPSGNAGARRPAWGPSIVRSLLVAVLVYLPLLGPLVLAIWPAMSNTRQGLPDVAARTQVIRR